MAKKPDFSVTPMQSPTYNIGGIGDLTQSCGEISKLSSFYPQFSVRRPQRFGNLLKRFSSELQRFSRILKRSGLEVNRLGRISQRWGWERETLGRFGMVAATVFRSFI